jgi:hypothetical protein
MSIYSKKSKGNQNYVQPDNDQQVEALDLNTYNGDRAVVFPRHIYAGDVVPAPKYLCSRPRDTQTRYIFGVERDLHPLHAANFGYARAAYGYGTGHWPGRYNGSMWCNQDDVQPPNMSPARFYAPDQLGWYSSQSEGYAMEQYGKNVLMRLPILQSGSNV